jgi:transposase
MTAKEKEEKAVLQMRIDELEKKSNQDQKKYEKQVEKIKKKHKKEISKKDEIIKSLREKRAEQVSEIEVLSTSIQSLRSNLRQALFLKFGNSSEQYRNLFSISKSDALLMKKLHDVNADIDAIKNDTLAKFGDNSLETPEPEDPSDSVQSDKNKDKKEDKNTKPKRTYHRNRNPKKRERKNCGGRQSYDSSFERNTVTSDVVLTHCPVCGDELQQWGEEISSEFIKLKEKIFTIEQYIRIKLICKKCNKAYQKDLEENYKSNLSAGLYITPPKNLFIKRGSVDDNVVADTAVGKYDTGIPNTRQEELYRRMGLTIRARNMTNWQHQLGEQLTPLAELIRKSLLETSAIGIDEKCKALHFSSRQQLGFEMIYSLSPS